MLIALIARAVASPLDPAIDGDAHADVDGDAETVVDATVEATVDGAGADAGADDGDDAGADDGDDTDDAEADAGQARLAHGLGGAARSHDLAPVQRPPSRWGRFDVALAWRRSIASPAGDLPRVIDQLWLLATWSR